MYIIPVRVRAARYRPQHKTRSIMSGRGGGGGGGGGGGRGGRGGGRGGRGGRGGAKKESILELARLQDATVRVKCIGGRELKGTLRGYDELVNLVLDECEEFLRGELIYIIYILSCVCIESYVEIGGGGGGQATICRMRNTGTHRETRRLLVRGQLLRS